MKLSSVLFSCSIVLLCFSTDSLAETHYEFTIGGGVYALDVDQKFGDQIEDDSSVTSISFGVYRDSGSEESTDETLDEQSFWGAVIEYSMPLGRDDNLPGNGQMIAFRPVNYLMLLDESSSMEFYAGIAQFDWIKTANGYLFGFNYRYNLFGESSGLMADFKYYQDLAYDSPQGDDIVDGFQSSIKFYYQF